VEERTDDPGATPPPDEALTVLREISARLGTMEQRLARLEASRRPAVAPPRPSVPPTAPRPAAPVPPAQAFWAAPTVPGAPPAPGAHPQQPLTGPPVSPAATPPPGARPPVQPPDGHLPPPPAASAAARLEAGTENRVGKYLLSGAAALLVLLSATTLIAMWWEAIPDLVKVSTVFAIGVVLTVIGTWLAIRRPGSVLHAATVTGIGGGLGFVGLMGASLLHLVAPIPSFAALSVWTLVLLGLAARTRLVFTIVIAALGGVATTALAAGQAAENPDQALLALLLMVAYAGATSLTSAVVVRSVSPPSRPGYLLAPLLLIITTAVLLPIEAAHWIFEPGVLAGVGLLLAILIGHVLVLTSAAFAAHGASPPSPAPPGQEHRPAAAQRPTQWAASWLSVPLVPFLLVARPGGLGSSLSLDAFSYLILAVLGVTALAQTLLASLRAASGAWACHCLFAAALLAGPIGIHLGSERTPLLLGATLLVALLAELPVVLAGRQSGVWTFGVLVFAAGALLSDRWALAAVILAAALTAIGVALVVDRRSGQNSAVRATSVLVAVLLVWRVPAAVGSVADGLALSTQQAMTLNWALSALAFVVLAALGLGAGLHGPVALLTGRFAGARAVIVPAALPGGTYRSSSQSAWVLAVLMWVWSWQLVPLADWDFWDVTAPGEQVQRLVLAAALLALAVTFVWLLAPLVALPLHGLATASGGTWFVVLATCLASRSGAAGVPAGIAMLVAGALSIVLGFRQKARAVRLFGLVLVIVMVLKFAFWDISAQSSLTRVVSLLIGGLICFALSVLYARADAQWGTAPGPSDPPPPGAPQTGHQGTPPVGTYPAVPQGGARRPHGGPTRV